MKQLNLFIESYSKKYIYLLNNKYLNYGHTSATTPEKKEGKKNEKI